MQCFASDNCSGICPEALEAFLKANEEHDLPYGEDHWTRIACDRFREVFESDCEVFFVYTGTASNALALAALCQSYHSVICHEYSHVEKDECGAPQFFSNGARLLLGEGENGKLTTRSIHTIATQRDDIHFPRPRAVSITQATEVGTVYTLDEIRALTEEARRLGLSTHMDGARFANAVAHLDCTPAEASWKAGIDVLSLGGTKNGMAGGEAVVFFDREMGREFEYRCKQAGHLISKMRFISSQWWGVMQNEVWLDHARHANAMADLLAGQLQQIPGVSLLFPRESNALFVSMPEEMQQHLREKGWVFYTFIGEGGIRLLCSWDTKVETIELFLSHCRESSNRVVGFHDTP
jgi:threonine aldolase